MLASESTEVVYHRLLKRQLRKSLPPDLADDPRLQEFLISVNQAYTEFQDDLSRVENILEQSSTELFKTNRELTRIAQEKTEEAASTSQRLEEVVRSITEVLVQLDENGKIVFLNKAWETLTGYPVVDTLEKNWNVLPVPTDERNRVALMISEKVDSIEATIPIKTSNHAEKWLAVSLRQHTSTDHQAGYIGTFVDVTERVDAEKKMQAYTRDLEKINAELDQFAYVVSHDLKAPLRAINNLSEWIEEDIEDLLEGDTKEQFKLLRGRVHRMEGLINGILSYSRAGRIKTAREQFLVRPVVEELTETFSNNKPTTFVMEGDPELEIVSEKITLIQILQNLISNGIKYNDKAHIDITIGWADSGPDQVEFFVRDNGPGISPEFHDRIFVIFQTLQSRDEVESTGVGLAIVKKIIDEKGGQIRVESATDEGSTFFFTWPRNEKSTQNAS